MSFKRAVGIIFLILATYILFKMYGLYEYLNDLNSISKGKLFPSVESGFYGEYSDQFQKWSSALVLFSIIHFGILVAFGISYIKSEVNNVFGFSESEFKNLLLILGLVLGSDLFISWSIISETSFYKELDETCKDVSVLRFINSSVSRDIERICNIKKDFVIGFVIDAILFLCSFTYRQSYFQHKINNSESVKSFNDFKDEKILRKNPKYLGNRILSEDAYKLFLIKEYGIERNEVLNKFTCKNKIFEDLNEVLAYAHKIDLEVNGFDDLKKEVAVKAEVLAKEEKPIQQPSVLSNTSDVNVKFNDTLKVLNILRHLGASIQVTKIDESSSIYKITFRDLTYHADSTERLLAICEKISLVSDKKVKSEKNNLEITKDKNNNNPNQRIDPYL